MIETASRLAGTSPGLGLILSGLALIPLAAGILLLLRPDGALAAPSAGRAVRVRGLRWRLLGCCRMGRQPGCGRPR
jgi:hypothetical protein